MEGRKTDLDEHGGVDSEIGLCEHGTNDEENEREGNECSEHGCSVSCRREGMKYLGGYERMCNLCNKWIL